MAYAHSPDPSGQWHDLQVHLRGTAERARTFAAPFGGGDVAEVLGLWHDIGKFHPAWQAYLQASTDNPRLRGTGPEHKLAGAILAAEHPVLRSLALVIAGHHGGLPAAADLRARLEGDDGGAAARLALQLAREAMPDLETVARRLTREQSVPAAIAGGGRQAFEHYVRMVFSALVDADFLDTEQHFDRGRSAVRTRADSTAADLLDLLLADQRTRFPGTSDLMGNARCEVFEACLSSAAHPPGWFRLAVPTGGGKTRAGLAFALRHAALHGLRRVVVAVPFVSITEQTAEVYRDIFRAAEDDIVLEHHSAFQESGIQDDDVSAGVTWSRVAAENWDAPVVVTTTVQLLESLFAHRPSRVRKLHNLAGSVVILDEVQSLPAHLLEPTLQMLDNLVRDYGVTVVLSTATQPAFEVLPAFAAFAATDIVPHPDRLYSALQRVEYEMRLDRKQPWEEVAGWLRDDHQALAIVNTKADAIALLEALDDPTAVHLSTLLCGIHRRDAIAEMKRRLGAGERCVVVSTQVVEAGVDLDFPAVYRALGPLDAIVQAAGRCNREGNLPGWGRVVVFDPAEGGLPRGSYRVGAEQAQRFLRQDRAQLDDPDTLERYYRALLPLLDTDARGIQERRDQFDYPEVAARYQLIEDDTESVVVTTYGTVEQQAEAAQLVEEARGARGNPRQVMRALQPFVVSLRRHQAERLRSRGAIEPLVPGLGVWRGEYNPVRGLVVEGNLDLMVV